MMLASLSCYYYVFNLINKLYKGGGGGGGGSTSFYLIRAAKKGKIGLR